MIANLLELLRNIYGETPTVEEPKKPETEQTSETTTTEDEIEEAEEESSVEVPATTTPETYPVEVVKSLREENKKRRLAQREAEKQIAQLKGQMARIEEQETNKKKEAERANLDEIARVKAHADDLLKELEALRAANLELEKSQQFIRQTRLIEMVARELKFIDPTDAVNFLTPEQLDEIEGDKVEEEELKEMVQGIADKRPYLVAKPQTDLDRPTNSASQVKIKGKNPGKPEDDDALKEGELLKLIQTGQGNLALKTWYNKKWIPGLRKHQGGPSNPYKST